MGDEVGDLPSPPPAGSSELEDKAYCAIRAFDVKQMTYTFSCEDCKERRLECKGTGNTYTRCKRDIKKEPKLCSDENNMDPCHVPEERSEISDAEC